MSGFSLLPRWGAVLVFSAFAAAACSLERQPAAGSRTDSVTAEAGKSDGTAGEDDTPQSSGGPATEPGSECDCTAGCSDPQCAIGENGVACDFDAQCKSLHCNQNVCCDGNVCCNDDRPCEGEGVMGRTCDEPASCQGSRGEVACVDFACSTREGVSDDAACDGTVMALDCGLYAAVFCSGEETQSPPSCPTSCETDAECRQGADCKDGVCAMPVVDGGECASDGDCASEHCSGGFCCAQGDCCASASDCPSSYFGEPECVSPSTCQGSRRVGACVDFTCLDMGPVDDDSACGTSIVASSCGAGTDVYCTGDAEQVAPVCEDGCAADSDCDDSAHCSETGVCVADGEAGAACERNDMCTGGRCLNGHCCTGGICCATAADCPRRFTTLSCVNVPECQGERYDAVCTELNRCDTSDVPVDDDSGCVARDVLDCGDYRNVSCNGEAEQVAACQFVCTTNADCDNGVPCRMGGACIPRQE